MLQNIKSFYGKKLSASDGEIGHVMDFYFDDQNWAVRYVVADTGSWLAGRQVLLSSRAFFSFNQTEKNLRANLTRKQIENSPSSELHKPVSRQYEEEYHRYYGWPCYWLDGGAESANIFPILEMPPKTLAGHPAKVSGQSLKNADSHLRSALHLDGYRLKASDGMIGQVCDFMIDTQNWTIPRLVVKTGHWPTGHEVEIPTSQVGRISYDESTVFVNLTGKGVEQSTPHSLASDVVAS